MWWRTCGILVAAEGGHTLLLRLSIRCMCTGLHIYCVLLCARGGKGRGGEG